MKNWLKKVLFKEELSQIEALKKQTSEDKELIQALNERIAKQVKSLYEAQNKKQEIYVNKSVIVNINDKAGLILNNEDGIYLGNPKEYNFAIDIIDCKSHYIAGKLFKKFLKDLTKDEAPHILINIKDNEADF